MIKALDILGHSYILLDIMGLDIMGLDIMGRTCRGSLIPRPFIERKKPSNLPGFKLLTSATLELAIPIRFQNSLASFPGSSAPEQEIEFIHAERAWYLFSREKHQRQRGGRETLIKRGRTEDSEQGKERW